MSYESNFDYNGDVSRVEKITFGIMSPKMIRNQSVVQVIHHDTFCGNNPVTGGLFDPRMGVLEYGHICSTDKQTNKDTPGYFGHIELSLPVFHIQYFPVVQKIVKCVCFRCGKLLTKKTDENIAKKNRLSHVYELSKKVKVCSSEDCKAVQPDKLVKPDSCKIQGIWVSSPKDGPEVETKRLNYTPNYVLNLFNQITDEDCWKMGINPELSHPSWMVLTVFPVCPPSCRPSVHQDNGQRMEDDITIKYCDIIKYNRMIQDKMKNEPDAKILEDWHNLLQYHISTLIDNEIAGIPPAAQRSGRPLKGLRQRLKGKEGRIRGNLMGKRVNFSSRTVITPDPVIDLDELGVPEKIAIQLTFPEKVTASNIRRLKEYVRNGCKIYPGARSVFKCKNKKTVSLNHIDRYQFANLLEIGDVVIRHIVNGDWVLFNRQPSLHKMSMMAHRIRILDGLTFRLNISATTPYNADFDGDEMNMHVPQSIAASNEISCLASVNNQIVSPALNMPIITFVQDSVLGGHLMTMGFSPKMTHREMMNALAWNTNYKGHLPLKEYSGKEGLSFCIPDTTLRMKNRKGKYIYIKNGEISSNSDVFDKKVFANLIHSIFRDNGAKKCASFFNCAQHMIRSYLLKNSFSVGIRDLVLKEDLHQAIEKAISQQILDAEKTIQTLHLNMFENMTSGSNKIAFENKLNQKLTAARSCAENLLKKAYDQIQTNRFMNMVDGGSKGKLINLAQMTACLGQQAIDGGRAPYGFQCRTLPHFEKFDDKAMARGFVSSSFQKGVNPLEFFFHAMAGREGIIDTAVKSVTWETKVIIIEDNQPRYTSIGDWIDRRLEENSSLVEKHVEKNLEILHIEELPTKVLIPTTDYFGNVSWKEVTALTRHDPGEKLYKIQTQSGREVTVTANKSLLIWKEKELQFKETFSNEIQPGDFVPVNWKVENPKISEKFKIGDKDFMVSTADGIFVGIYIVCGEYISYSSDIQFKNFDEEVYAFKKSYLSNVYSKVSKTEFGKFLVKLVGTNENKNIPDMAFAASDEFVIGLITGIMSSVHLVINKGDIIMNFNTERMCDSIMMIFSRIGIFTEMKKEFDSYSIIIPHQWNEKLTQKIELMTRGDLHSYNNILPDNSTNIYKEVNDVVLDKILSIDVIGTEEHPKMYDLTIPSTFNFSLANGLEVRDTSSTGYIQRKLMKALEDYKISWSGSVKDAQNDVIQFLYGDDNTDSISLEYQSVPIVDIEDLKSTYYMEPDENGCMTEFCKELEEMKDWYVKEICENSPEETTKFPVHIERVLRRIIADYGLDSVQDSNQSSSLTPYFILSNYEKLLEEIQMNHLNPGTWMVKFILYMHAHPRRLIEEFKMTEESFHKFLCVFKELFMRSRIEPGDAVGPVSAQSIGEPTTQLTLNSVTYETEILVRDSNKNIMTYQIGDFVEKNIKKNPQKTEYYNEKDTTWTPILDDEYYEIPSIDENGKIDWKKIEAVTQHPVVNKDGSNTLLKVTTEQQREVIATKAKSFLQLINGKVQEAEGEKLAVGQHLLVSLKRLEYEEKETLDLKTILSPKEYIYYSEVEKAKAVMHERCWWFNHYNKTFTVPHSRSDSFRDSVNKDKTKQQFHIGCVYPKKTGQCKAKIPEKIPLDYDFGYLVGAYSAEGCVTNFQVSIANNDRDYLEPIKRWCRKYDVTTKIYNNDNKNQENWKSQDIRLYSKMLRDVLVKLAGRLSHLKEIHDLITFSNKECIKGFLDAYIGGDGTINFGKRNSIYICSVSKKNLLGIQQMLNYIGIYSYIKKQKKLETNNRKTKEENIHQPYHLTMSICEAVKLSKVLNIKIENKQSKVNLLSNYIPERLDVNYETIYEIIDDAQVKSKRNGKYTDVYFDLIKSIEEIPSPTKYVYDLTVAETRNFNIKNGLCMVDTFHLSGVGGKTNITRGVPRLQELFNLSKNPKNSSLTVKVPYPKGQNKEYVQKVSAEICQIYIKSLLSNTQIIYEPEVTEELREFHEFEKMFDEFYEDFPKSSWVLVLTFDKKKILEMNICMEEIHYSIIQTYPSGIKCQYTDDNSKNLMIRIKIDKMNQELKKIIIPNAIPEVTILNHICNRLVDDVIIRGIDSIHNVSLRQDIRSQSNKEWLIDTDGSNIIDVILHPAVDGNRTISNDVIEMHQVFGIEAARQTIIREIHEVMDEAAEIDPRHINLLVDMMTTKGKLIPIDRNGMKLTDVGPLGKCSFEEADQQLYKAAIHGETDNITGVSANIILGQAPPCGTGTVDVKLDNNKFMELMRGSVDMVEETEEPVNTSLSFDFDD
tara:strand:+ start:549 stop:7397 length:6849 start_codon:yes stop_codon:yes gene_type:complete